jgi:N-acyl-phosphatidylethanolamine-hydrolysing phospholipase D
MDPSMLATTKEETTTTSSTAKTTHGKSMPLFVDGRYDNPFPNLPKRITLKEGLKWRFFEAENVNPLEGVDLDRDLPVVRPDFALWSTYSDSAVSQTGMTYTWIGHATTFLQTDGLNILFDPMFSERASAWQRIGPRRVRPVPCNIDELPPIDVIMISHNHYDHLDYNSVSALYDRMKNDRSKAKENGKEERICHWVVPMGMKDWLIQNVGINSSEITELTWWESINAKFSLKNEKMNIPSTTRNTAEISTPGSSDNFSSSVTPTIITVVPSLHWTQRGLFDSRKQLWCGFVIESPTRKIYYSGDTAYCEVFKEIGAHFGKIDLAILPIGAYSPRHIMKGAHVDPVEAVQIMEDVRATQSFGVHFGTFILAQEPFLEPRSKIAEEIKRRGWKEDAFLTTKHGETLELFKN